MLPEQAKGESHGAATLEGAKCRPLSQALEEAPRFVLPEMMQELHDIGIHPTKRLLAACTIASGSLDVQPAGFVNLGDGPDSRARNRRMRDVWTCDVASRNR
jgi:hypothetical protein